MKSSRPLSAKDLIFTDFSKQEEKKGTHHEFQDYAYRLASDLNDLEHLDIYMRCAKRYPHWLLDQVYEFVADVAEPKKGPLFMWKLKQVRKKIQLKADMQNFDNDFVFKKMRFFREKYASNIIAKNDKFEINSLAKLFPDIDLSFLTEKSKILFLGFSSSLLISYFASKEYRLKGIEASRKIRDSVKKIFEGNKKVSFISKDIITAKDKSTYDFILIENWWTFLPLEKETELLLLLKDLISETGQIMLGIRFGHKDEQKWNLMKEDEDSMYLTKINDKGNFIEKLDQVGFFINKEIELENITYFVLQNNPVK